MQQQDPTTTTTTEPKTIYISLTTQTIKVGTCDHCVVTEKGRPDRAWDAEGDRELDFDRDALIQRLATLGVQVDITQQYVCP